MFEGIGPPEELIRPGDRSHSELVGETIQRYREKEAARAPVRFLSRDPFSGAPAPAVIILDDDAVPSRELLPLDARAYAALVAAKLAYLEDLESRRANLGLARGRTAGATTGAGGLGTGAGNGWN